MDLEAFKKLRGAFFAASDDPARDASDLYARAARAKLPAEQDGATVAIKNPDTGARVVWVTFEPPMTVRSTDVKAALKDLKMPKRKG